MLAITIVGALPPAAAHADTQPQPSWSQISTQGPSPRESAYMAYDSIRGKVVLFGGYEPAGSGRVDSDTWEFDGTIWTQIPVSGPPAGALGQMVFDSSRGVTVLFGGGNTSTFLAPITWEWDGATWTARFTPHRPPGRVWFGMTYDSARHVVVLFGGSGLDAGGNHTLFAETWEYDGNDWRQVVTAHSPSGRYGHGLAYDAVRGKAVLFGGHDDTTGRLNDTWEYAGGDWTQVAVPNPPYARFQHSMAYVPALGKVVVFGGDYFVPSVTLGPTNETLAFDGASWQPLTTTDHPSPRTLAPAAYDGANARLVVFGGSNDTFPDTVVGDTWALVVPQTTATLSVTSLQFPQQPVLSTTTSDVTLTNTGTAPLALSSVSAGGDFGATDSCPRPPASLAPNSACTITVSFTPSSGNGTITGALVLTDNAGSGTQSIPLSGSGQWGQLDVLPASIDFGSAVLGTPFAAVTETITVREFPTLISAISADSGFTVNNLDCPLALLSVGTTCHVEVGFAPNRAATYNGRLVIQDNEAGLRRVIPLTGTALPPPVSVTLEITPLGTAVPTFGHAIQVVAHTNATSGEASFTFNGHQLGAPQPINPSGSSVTTITLDDSTVPAGAGSYPLLVFVHPTDTQHADNSVTQLVTVVPTPEQLSWNGSGLAVAGSSASLSATVTPPAGETQFDFAAHIAWVRFDVTDGSGTVTSYYAQVAPPGTASVSTTALAPGAYSVRARFVAGAQSAAPNAYVASEDVRTAFAAQPVRGGYLVGVSQQSSQAVAFEFASGSRPSGSLVWITSVQVTGSDGRQHDAYRVIVSTSVSSVGSRSRTATASGAASVMVVDATTGERYSAFDQTTTFQLNLAADGSGSLSAGGYAASLPPGTGVNHL